MAFYNKSLGYIYNCVHSYWPYLSITIVNFLLVYHWLLEKNVQLAHAENAILFYPIPLYNALYAASYAWSYAETGSLNGFVTAGWPFNLFSYYLSFLGISPAQIQGIWFFILLEIGSVSIIKLTNYVTGNNLKGNVASFLAGLFYLFNPVTSYLEFRFLYSFWFFYSYIPFYLYSVTSIVIEDNVILIPITIIISFLFTLSWGEPTNFVSFLLFIIPYSIILSVSMRRNMLKVLALIIGFLGSNAFWISTFIPYYFWLNNSPLSLRVGTPGFNASLFIFISISEHVKSVFTAFSLGVPLDFYSGLYNSWIAEYNLKFLDLQIYNVVALILVSLSFLSISLIKNIKTDRKSLFLFVFLVYSTLIIGLIPGAASPFGSVNLYMFEHFPLFVVYRNPYEKFGLLLPIFLSPVFGSGVYVLFSKISTRTFKTMSTYAASAVLVGLLLLSGWPVWTGAAFAQYYVTVPSYYWAFDNYIKFNNITGYRFLVLPEAGLGAGMAYEWGHYEYTGIELADQLFYGDVVDGPVAVPWIYSTPYYSNSIFLNYTNISWKYMYLLDAKYIIVQTDVNYTLERLPNPQLFLSVINSSKDFVLLYHVGALYLYENKLIPNPKMIQAYTSITTVNNFQQFLEMLYYNDSYFPNETVVIIRNITTTASVVSHSLSKPPIVEYSEINPAVYVVRIVNATSPFYLVLDQCYSPYWRAYYGVINPYDFRILTAQDYISGFEANGYATGFFINKTGTFYVTLINIAQVYMNLGMIVTGITLLSSFLVLAFNLYKLSKKNKVNS